MAPLTGKHVLIIGGSSGIGFGVARAALAEGARVTIASSSESKGRVAAERLWGDSMRTEVVNTAEESEIKALFERVGVVDHLVYTAGDNAMKDWANMDFASIKKFADVRYYGVLMCARYAKNRITGSFTVTSSTSGMRPLPGLSNVIGVPGALENTARALAIDLAPIRVNNVAAGLIDTEMYSNLPKEVMEGYFQRAISTFPVGHVGTPEEIAEAYLFSTKCSYLTGQTIIVDGGSNLV